MRSVILCWACLLPVVLPGCATAGWSNQDALAANSLELQVDGAGKKTEIEYHIDPGAVPAHVRAAMDRLHPGGPFVAAEKEWNGGVLYFELTRRVEGMEIEAMFRPDGTLHLEEIQVPRAKVVASVRDAVRALYPGVQVNSWEEIRLGDRKLSEYHVKLLFKGAHLKLAMGLDGHVHRAWREIPSEIEVPLSGMAGK